MATPREIRYRLLYVAIGLLLIAITAVVLMSDVDPWWAVVPGVLAFGWWATLVKALGDVAMGYDDPGDTYRYRPE